MRRQLLWAWLRPQLPGWPRFSGRLWGWLLLGVFSFLSLLLKAELWPHTPRAETWSLAALLLAVAGASWQIVKGLLRWVDYCQGPYLLRAMLRIAIGLGVAGLVLGGATAALSLLFLLARSI